MRVILIGNGGAGKSTLARRMAKATNWPLLSLDHVWHATDYSDQAKRQFAETQKQFMARSANWIIDGNYNGTMPARIEAADLIVWCQVPRPSAIFRVIRRSLRFRRNRATRPEMPDAFSEHFDRQYLDFLLFVWRYPERARQNLQPKLDQLRADQQLVIVRTKRQKDALVRTVVAQVKN